MLGLAVVYFGLGQLLYFGATVLLGWGIGLLATVGLTFTALLAASARVHATRPLVPGSVGSISMDFASTRAVQLLAILCFAALPYAIWRLCFSLIARQLTAERHTAHAGAPCAVPAPALDPRESHL
jgi:hypothetical protein